MRISFTSVRNGGLSIMILIIILTGWVSYSHIQRIAGQITDVLNEDRPTLRKILEIRLNFVKAKDCLTGFLMVEAQDTKQIVSLMDEVITTSEELSRSLSSNKDIINEFAKEAKRFKVGTIAYSEEFYRDPGGAVDRGHHGLLFNRAHQKTFTFNPDARR